MNKANKAKTGKRLYIRTFGCQMNDRDSEFIKGLFLEKGYKLVSSPEEADAILFNTCSVRAHAEERAIQNMALLMRSSNSEQHAARRTPHTVHRRIFGMVGCMAQAMKERLFEKLAGLDIVCGTGEIARLPELVEKARCNKVTALGCINEPLPELNPSYRENDKSAYVSVMHGCDNFCSYCVVPYVRGRERSRDPEYIIQEIRELVQKGIADITLLGQNVNSYKPPLISTRDFLRPHTAGRKPQTHSFVDLLKDVNNIDGLESIRFLTSHPKDATIKLFKAMRDLNKVAKHLHLPMQSGSDRILRLMNRGYTRGKYLSLVTKARELIPNLRLTTDIIVGFPTETERDFNDTLKLMKEIKFDLAYIFKYSTRPLTKAARLKDDVPPAIKKRRHRVLLDLQKEISGRKRADDHGRRCEEARSADEATSNE